MLKKKSKPQYPKYIRSGAKAFFFIETVLFAASYGIWYRMNTSRGEWVDALSQLGLLSLNVIVISYTVR
jgi:hypothetical protein